MCNRRSEDQVEVCAVATENIKQTMGPVKGAILETLPETGDILVTNTDPAQRGAFETALEEAVAPYRQQGAC